MILSEYNVSPELLRKIRERYQDLQFFEVFLSNSERYSNDTTKSLSAGKLSHTKCQNHLISLNYSYKAFETYQYHEVLYNAQHHSGT